MRISPRRRANRAVFAGEAASDRLRSQSPCWPLMGATLWLLLCRRRLPATANSGVGAFPGAKGLRGPDGRFDHDDDSWPQALFVETNTADMFVVEQRRDYTAFADEWQ